MNTSTLPALNAQLNELRDQIAESRRQIQRHDEELSAAVHPGPVLENLIQRVAQREQVHPSVRKLVKDFEQRRRKAEHWERDTRPHDVAELERAKEEHDSVAKAIRRLEDEERNREEVKRALVESEKTRVERLLDKQIELEQLRCGGVSVATGYRSNATGEPLTGADSSKVRARQVGIVRAELDRIAPLMTTESEYERLSQQFAGTVTFKVCNAHRELRTKLESIQEHQQYVRFSLEIVAAKYGRKFSTVQKDWKTHKPKKVRMTNGSRKRKRRTKSGKR